VEASLPEHLHPFIHVSRPACSCAHSTPVTPRSFLFISTFALLHTQLRDMCATRNQTGTTPNPHVRAHTHTHVHTHTCTHTHSHTCVHTHTHTHAHTHAHSHTCLHTRACTRLIPFSPLCLHTCLLMRKLKCTTDSAKGDLRCRGSIVL